MREESRVYIISNSTRTLKCAWLEVDAKPVPDREASEIRNNHDVSGTYVGGTDPYYQFRLKNGDHFQIKASLIACWMFSTQFFVELAKKVEEATGEQNLIILVS